MGTRKFTRGRRQNVRKRTLKELFARFMIEKRTEGMAKKTLEDYELHFGYLLDFTGGDLEYIDIEPGIFREYTDYMLNERELSPVTVNIRIRTIRHFLRYSYESGWLSTPIHDTFRTVKTGAKEIEVLTVDEVNALLGVLDLNRYVDFRTKVMIMTTLDSMVRVSELAAIERKNVDLKTGNIRLDAGNTKTKHGRTVPLSDVSIKLLAEYLDETADFEGAERLFLTFDGKPINTNTFRHLLNDAGEQAGIQKSVSPHLLRHTGAVLYVMNGGDPFSLQDILGHTTMDMVRHYVQLSRSQVKRQHNKYSPLNGIS